MSLSRLRQLLCGGQNEKVKDVKETNINQQTFSNEVSWSQYSVKLEVETIMKRRPISSKVLLKTSITTVLAVLLTFITLYTVALVFFTPVQLHYQDSRGRYRLIAKNRFGNSSHRNRVKNQVLWNLSDVVNIHFHDINCRKKLVILILITSSVHNYKKRDAIRKTWCLTNPHHENAWQCLFLVGQPEESKDTSELHQRLKVEKMKNKDILHGSYIDSYRNLTYKVMHGLSWANTNCPAKVLLKTDDDCFVNTRLLYDLVMHHQDVKNLYVGNANTVLEKRTVIRNSDNRWHVLQSDFSEKFYPVYASGAGYLLSWDVVKKLVLTSSYVKVIPIEDAYIGILAREIGVEPLHSSRFTLMSDGWTKCNYAYLVVIHNVDFHEQEKLMQISLDAPSACNVKEEIYTWN